MLLSNRRRKLNESKSYINKRVGRHYTLVQNWLHVYEKINGRLHFAMSQSLHGQLYHDYCTNAFFFHRIFFLALNSIIIWSEWRQWSDDDVFLNSYFMLGNALQMRYAHWEETIFRLTAASWRRRISPQARKKLSLSSEFFPFVTKWHKLDLNF